jgi:hypothetical protein
MSLRKVVSTCGDGCLGSGASEREEREIMLLVQTLAQDATRFYDKGCGVAAMALAEAMCIPVDVLPEDPRELYKWAEAYVKYAYGLESQPEWFKDEWLGEDW